MEFDDFKIGMFFFTATGRWMVIDTDPVETIVFAMPSVPNRNLDGKLDTDEPLIMEFDEYDFGGCDLEDRFNDRT